MVRPVQLRGMSGAITAIVFVCLAQFALGQGRFTVNGRMKVEGSDLSGARAVVYKNGVKERSITSNLSKFVMELELNANYIVSFEKDGYVAKKLSFNTHVPADAAGKGFTPFDFAVSLFKQYDDINLVVFNQPVGVIRYEPSLGDFDYDTDYTKSIQSQLQDVVAQVERKQKDEARSNSAEEKRKAEEAKAQAKAQAEAEKQAAAHAAEAAKAKAEAERQAAARAQAAAEAEKSARAKEEEARKEAGRRREQQAAASNSAPVEKIKPQPAPPPVPGRNPVAMAAKSGEEGRRTAEPVMAEESSRVVTARANKGEESVPEPPDHEIEVTRTEDLIVEATKVTTVVRLEAEGKVTEYRRVFHKWGGIFYFRDGLACSQAEYDGATRSEQLAGATPRGKLD